MDPLSVAASVAGLATFAIETTHTLTTYYHAVKDGPKTIENMLQEMTLMQSVLAQLDKLLKSQSMKNASFDQSSVLATALSTCERTVQAILAKLRSQKQGTVLRAVANLKWPFTEKETQKRLEELRRCTSAFQFSLTVEGCNLLSQTSDKITSSLELQLYTSKKVLELTKDIGVLSASAIEASKVSAQLVEILQLMRTAGDTKSAILKLDENVAALGLRSQESKEQEVLDWLSSIRYSKKHSDVRSRRLSGTGQWLLDCAVFQAWLNFTSPVLWCTGNPGAGKSVLTSLVIDKVLEQLPVAGTALAYFYFDFGEQAIQTPLYFVGSLTRQMAIQTTVFPSSLLHFHTRFREDEAHGSTEELITVLREICATFERCYIVVDALDECQKGYRKQVLKILNSLTMEGIQLFVTSRPHPHDLKQHFENTKHINVEARETDVRSYCLQLMNDDKEIEDLIDCKLKDEVAETIARNAQGMFLLPVLQMQVILEAMTKSEIRKILRNLSANLGQAFQNTIQRIDNEPRNRRTVAQQALMWVSHAYRPLQITELRHALATQLGDEKFDVDNLLQPRFIIECCFGLVVIDDESSTVRLVHHTLQDFLHSEREKSFMEEETNIAKICLTYMCMSNIDVVETDQSGFLRYAATHWGHHARRATPGELDDLAISFLKSPDKVSQAEESLMNYPNQRSELRWHRNIRVNRKGIGSETTGLHVAASFGLTRLVQCLINTGLSVDLTNDQGCTALHEAATNGQVETAELLISLGSNIDARNVDFNTPLFLAIASAHEDMVRLLLEHGANPDIHCVDYWTALHEASDKGHVDIVRILLKHGASLRSQSGRGLTALHRAAGRGYIETMEFVFCNFLVDATTKDGWTPLHGASSSGQHLAARWLIEKGADINHQCVDGRTPLHRASRGGHSLTVAVLLEKGANFLILDCSNNIPLHRAAKGGHKRITQLLLDQDPSSLSSQLTQQHKYGRTPRGEASYSGHWKTAAILREAELRLQDSHLDTRSTLDIAVEAGDLDQVKELLMSGVEVNKLNSDGVTPLHQAFLTGSDCLAKILIEGGADFEVTTADGWKPLHCAAKKGSETGVRLCLEHGADVHATTKDGQTALHKVCKSGVLSTAELLIEKGADLEAADYWGWRPLHTSSAAGFQDIVKLLIAKGADQTARDKQYVTVQACAARAGHHALVEYLRMERHKLKDKSRSFSSGSLPTATMLSGTTIEDRALANE